MNLIKITAAALLFFFLSKNSYAEEKLAQYRVKSDPGIIGCLTKEDFQQVTKYSVAKDSLSIQSLVNNGRCSFLAKNTIIYSSAGICGSKDNGADLFLFKPRGTNKEVYLPCFSVK